MNQPSTATNTNEFGSAALRFDIVAGLTAAAVVLPKAMAYATVAGLPVAVALYTAFIPMVIGAGMTSAMRALVSLARRTLGPGKGRSVYLLGLFPGSPARVAAKIAGLPRPEHCL